MADSPPVAYNPLLPWPVRDSYSFQYANAFTPVQMDDGNNRSFRNTLSQPRAFTLTWILNWSQCQLWEGWFAYDLDNGSNFAIIPLNDLHSITVQFTKDNYQVTSQDNIWTITATVQKILDAPVYTEGVTEYPVWPDALPEPETDNYSYKRQGAIHDSLNTGWQDSRVRFQKLRADCTFTIILEQDHLDIMNDFISNDLIDGLRWFKMILTTGDGPKLVRAKLTSTPVISSQGSIFSVALAVETFELPLVSGLKYKYPDGTKIIDSITIGERIQTLFQGAVRIAENIRLVETVGRRYFANDTITVSDKVYAAMTTHRVDSFTLTDSTHLVTGLARNVDATTLGESYHVAMTVKRIDSFTISEAVAASVSYSRSIVEAITLVEAIGTKQSTTRTSIDSAVISDQGSWRMQDYTTDTGYFGQDYVGASGTF